VEIFWHWLKNKRKIFKMIKDKVQESLGKVRPMLQRDGGDVELVEVDEDSGIVKVNLTGACKGCPMSQITLKSGIERYLKSEIPEVTSVVEA
jgi:Fe-S cluster biogenesis protein NfuA